MGKAAVSKLDRAALYRDNGFRIASIIKACFCGGKQSLFLLGFDMCWSYLENSCYSKKGECRRSREMVLFAKAVL